MAEEEEELILRVRLDAESATAQMRQLQEQMKSLGTGGAGGRAAEQPKRRFG